jgi:coenzyme PQQ precursor peptide PqqA
MGTRTRNRLPPAWASHQNTRASTGRRGRRLNLGEELMKKSWQAPKIVEIAVGMEINSYACAELKK